MTVQRICSRSVDTVQWGEPVQVAAHRMHSRNVGCLVVVDSEQLPIGIVTDRDLAVRVVSQGRDAAKTKVGDVMTSAPRTIHHDVEIEEAIRLMRTGPFRRLPVVDDYGKVVGLLSLDDIVQMLSEEFRGIDRLLQYESPEALEYVRIPESASM